MPKGDIELPNESGRKDPRLEPSARAQASNVKAFYDDEAVRTKPKKKPAKRSVARRIYEGVRTIRRAGR